MERLQLLPDPQRYMKNHKYHKKRAMAQLSAVHCNCMTGAFFLFRKKPQASTIYLL